MIDASTKAYALLGSPVRHSLSPAIHNALFQKYDINAVYLAFEISDTRKMKDLVQSSRILLKGFNVTMPYKRKVLNFLDDTAEEVDSIKAINTVVNSEGKLIGYNTDGFGALKALEREAQMSKWKVLLLGAGGAGRSIAYSLSKSNDLVVLNRSVEKAKDLEGFGLKGEELNIKNLEHYLAWADVLINATSVGMDESKSIVPRGLLHDRHIVLDIVYSPLKTKLLKDAEARGCRVIDGLWMLIYQGARSFELWTGIKPDVDFMRKIALEALNHEN
jgi:shikimate dehydrogenase